jgi:hypothetical protein
MKALQHLLASVGTSPDVSYIATITAVTNTVVNTTRRDLHRSIATIDAVEGHARACRCARLVAAVGTVAEIVVHTIFRYFLSVVTSEMDISIRLDRVFRL